MPLRSSVTDRLVVTKLAVPFLPGRGALSVTRKVWSEHRPPVLELATIVCTEMPNRSNSHVRTCWLDSHYMK
jgi:hypothetical protein